MADFNIAYKIGRSNEGGYSLNLHDKGGETYAGIARNYWPKWEGWKVIDKYKSLHPLKQGIILIDPKLDFMIEDFYRENFWNRIKGDYIEDQQVANIFYDWLLTSGKAISKVQEILDVTPDNKFGPDSLSRINKAIKIAGGQYMFEMIKKARINYYLSLNQPAFEKGWLNRVDSFKYS